MSPNDPQAILPARTLFGPCEPPQQVLNRRERCLVIRPVPDAESDTPGSIALALALAQLSMITSAISPTGMSGSSEFKLKSGDQRNGRLGIPYA
jgi:hypothetical protein